MKTILQSIYQYIKRYLSTTGTRANNPSDPHSIGDWVQQQIGDITFYEIRPLLSLELDDGITVQRHYGLSAALHNQLLDSGYSDKIIQSLILVLSFKASKEAIESLLDLEAELSTTGKSLFGTTWTVRSSRRLTMASGQRIPIDVIVLVDAYADMDWTCFVAMVREKEF